MKRLTYISNFSRSLSKKEIEEIGNIRQFKDEMQRLEIFA
jgi:hypothetical protein